MNFLSLFEIYWHITMNELLFVAMVTDIAVGAYLSDRAFLIFGQSVINMEISIKLGVAQIDPYPDAGSSSVCTSADGSTTVPCFDLDICFSYFNSRISTISE